MTARADRAVGAVTMYTDGACRGNPGPGGYGVVLLGVWGGRDNRKELCGDYRRTTNNRMELVAAIKGLESLKQPCAVDAYSDSTYVVNGFSKGWARKWEEKGWRASRRSSGPRAPPDARHRSRPHRWPGGSPMCSNHLQRCC